MRYRNSDTDPPSIAFLRHPPALSSGRVESASLMIRNTSRAGRFVELLEFDALNCPIDRIDLNVAAPSVDLDLVLAAISQVLTDQFGINQVMLCSNDPGPVPSPATGAAPLKKM